MSEAQQRTVGLVGATGVGIGAIVGGGILVLAGAALAESGPGAIVAFALNGAVAILTAMSFAEISSAFPDSGGAYTFAKKVLSVRSAFAVGWILWFAYIVAGVLYALGFASFAQLFVVALADAFGATAPAWVSTRGFALFLACAATGGYALTLIRKSAGGKQWATIGKVVVFAILIVVGVVAVLAAPRGQVSSALTPFFSGGAPGLFAAMGFTFIALQGFDLIAAIAGEVKDPTRTIPRAMFYSLGAALAVYLPLLFIVSTVGVGPGQQISELAAANPDTVIATAVRNYMGPFGFWLVIVAAILSTMSALQANLLASSRVALSMARDRTLPTVLGDIHAKLGTPVMAIYASALAVVAILFMVPNLAAAGAAASLIFLLSFGLAHVTAYLARRRASPGASGYRTPLFPAVPVIGGASCAGLAVFQAIVVPGAGGIVFVWLGLGVILYFALFAKRAEVIDASAEGFDPDLIRLRGRNPLVLTPIANPESAEAMVGVANALAPAQIGRVLLLSIVRAAEGRGDDMVRALEDAQSVIRLALQSSYRAGRVPEALITAAPQPWEEIRRVAGAHDCQSLLIGVGRFDRDSLAPVEALMAQIDRDIAIMRAPKGWRLENAKRILVPLGGRGEQHEWRARILGSLARDGDRRVTFVQVIPKSSSERDATEAKRSLSRLAEVRTHRTPEVVVVRDDEPVRSITEMSSDFDLLILGLRSTGGLRTVGDVRHLRDLVDVGRKTRLIGDFAIHVAEHSSCATIMLSRRLSVTPW